jgi:hypothetical protein
MNMVRRCDRCGQPLAVLRDGGEITYACPDCTTWRPTISPKEVLRRLRDPATFTRLWLMADGRLPQVRMALDHLRRPEPLCDGDIDLLMWAAELPGMGWMIRVSMDLHDQGLHDLVPGLLDQIEAALLRLDDAE